MIGGGGGRGADPFQLTFEVCKQIRSSTVCAKYCLCIQIQVIFFQKADGKTGAIISRLTAQMRWICEDNNGAQVQVPKVSWHCIIHEGFFAS